MVVVLRRRYLVIKIVKTDDVIFSQLGAGLYFDNLQYLWARVRQTTTG